MPTDRYRRAVVRYYNYLADWADAHRWDYFSWKHDLSEFVPERDVNLDYFSVRHDEKRESKADFYPCNKSCHSVCHVHVSN